MQRAEIVDSDQPLKIVTRDIPATPSRGARIRTTYAGICHSDLHLIQDEGKVLPGKVIRKRDILPAMGMSFSGIVPGHEIAGVIEELGSDHDIENPGLAVGDTVLVYPWVGCSKCIVCIEGNSHICDKNPGMNMCYGLGPFNPGGYSTHVIVNTLDILFKIPTGIPLDIACMLPCSGLTAYGALKKAESFLKEGYLRNKQAKLLIAGAGGLGMWALQLALIKYKDLNIQITVADINEGKIEFAKQNGAHLVQLWKKEFPDQAAYFSEIQMATKAGEYLFDAAIDFVGANNTFDMAYRSIRKNGILINVGLFGAVVQVGLLELTAKQIHFVGHVVGNMETMKELADFIKDKDIKYPPLEKVSLNQVNDTLDKLRKGQINGRALIAYTEC